MTTESHLGLSAIGWHAMMDSWWNKMIAIFLLATVIIGSSYLVYRLYLILKVYWLRKQQRVTVPKPVARYLARLRSSAKPLTVAKISSEELKSFGVYLGSFSTPATPAQTRLLSQWDVVVLNPLEAGVANAVSSCAYTSPHVLGRVDIDSLLKSEQGSGSQDTIRSIRTLDETITMHFRNGGGNESPFTAVLLANFSDHFSAPVLNQLVSYINALGLNVWLELAPPAYLSDAQCRAINMKAIRGVVYRNGTIRPDGDWQNFHHMEAMRTAMRAVAAQRVVGGPPMVLWETIDDGVKHQYAVVQRTFNWCRYTSALCWIGSRSALFNAEAASSETINDKPLGSMMWMKDDKNMKAHNIWCANDKISSEHRANDELYDTLNDFIPDLAAKLRFQPSSYNPHHVPQENPVGQVVRYSQGLREPRISPLSRSSDGADFTGLGCFQLGLDATPEAFDALVASQVHLRDLELLQRLGTEELQAIRKQIKVLRDVRGSKALSATTSLAVDDLVSMLDVHDDTQYTRLDVFVGLHSGFQTGADVQFWGLFDFEGSSGGLDIYLSGFTQDRVSTVLHTFLSSRGCTRAECFMAEFAMSEQNGTMNKTWQLPQRIVSDIEKISPTEALLLRQRLTVSSDEDSFLLARIRAYCEYQLMDIPSLNQLRSLNAKEYLCGRISAESLVSSRLNWLQEKGWAHSNPVAAVQLFEDVNTRLYEVLMNGESELYGRISVVMQTTMQNIGIDPGADLFALGIFCAFRKLALEETFLEVLDRNPFPNHATDQAGVFAESFMAGSRTSSFFDITPRELGKIISDRYRPYYNKFQPPDRAEGYTELPTTYAAMQVDSDPDYGSEQLSMVYKFTFLGIFAVPALIDIFMLTTIGRGLYLTTFMTSDQKTMATTALMLALLVCGGVGSWITSGGCYYIYASAFPAMNMYVLTRFVAGLAIVIVGCVTGFIVVTVDKGAAAGGVFAFYFAMLSVYLMTLSALSIYQVPGSSFKSGRTVVMMCVPILFISPVLTIWVQHDIAVYLLILTVFVCSLLYGTRKVMGAWTTWYLNIPSIQDAEVISWYCKRHDITGGSSEDMKKLSASGLPRNEFHGLVLKEFDRKFWTPKTKDPLVAKMTDGYESTKFLMGWYCRHRRTAMPLPYSSTWNLTIKAALENITNMQKGLKLHNAFLHWRHTGSDVWSGILYFVVALMDKWATILTSGGMVGLSAANSEEYRLAVGFGLSYYLIGAVSLDGVSQPLWIAANEKIAQPITSLASLQNVTDVDASSRRALYFNNLLKFFFLHIWGASVTAALMWTFDDSAGAMVMYIAYVVAYSGLLLYQYNKIYCRFDGAQSLAVASVIGLPVGIALRITLPTWAYTSVVSLGIACWISAIHSIYVTKIGWPRMPWRKSRNLTDSSHESVSKEQSPTFSCSTLEPYPALSQATLSRSFELIKSLSVDQHFDLKPSEHPGARVQEYLVHRSAAPRSNILQAAFPSAQQIIERTVELWSSGHTMVELVGARHFPRGDHKLRSITRKVGDRLHVLIALGPDLGEDELKMDVHRNSKIIAEAIIQATCEHHLGMSRDHSMLAQLVAVEESGDSEVPLPENIKRHLETSESERTRVINSGNKVLIRHLCLGVDPDIEWDLLHQDIRSFLLKLLSGQFDPLSAFEEKWIHSRTCVTDGIDSDEFIARYDLSAALTTSTVAYAKALSRSQGLSGSNLNDMDDLYLNDSEYFANSHLKVNVASRGPVSRFVFRVTRIWKSCLKFLILSLVADPEFQRELDWMIRTQPLFIHWPVTFLLNAIWSYAKFLQGLIIPTVLFHGRDNIAQFRSNIQGTKTILQKNRVVVENLRGPSTCFWSRQADGTIRLSQYNGNHDKEPDDLKQLTAINTYGDRFLLRQREEYQGEKIINMFTYEYPQGKKTNKLPLQRQCIQGKLSGEIVQYDWRGYITTGSTFRGVNPVQFTYWYRRSAKFEDELLRGEFVFPHITIRIMWSMPPRNHPERLDDWVPFPKVTEATFIEGSDVHHATWAYEHKFHPTISTTLNGVDIDTPLMIRNDWFHVLEKPQKLGFLSDNPLTNFASVSSNFASRFLGLNVKRYPMSTAHARTQLWKLWKSGQSLDAVTARWLDENLLRKDSMLKTYWRNRDWGMLNRATKYLDAHADSIMARTDVDSEISSWVHVAYKMSDLYSFGSGGDTTINTRTHSGQIQDSDDELHVMAMDTSTWPYEPGGVSACRRDMVNDLKTTKWHIVAEMAHDYGVPKFQIERNVKSLTVLPLWGLDFLNPTHGMLRNTLDSEVVERSYDTRTSDIRKHFIPILTSLVQCSRTSELTLQHLEEATKALCDLNTYFESSRSWNDVWSSDIVKSTWRELWLSEDVPGALNVSEWWDYEKPTMQQLDQALNLWCRYLFIFSTPVPDKIPDIFQASHHFTGATYGILCKVKRKVSLHVWDHCISFREFTVFMSSAVSFDMPFVNSSLISLGHLACTLLEHHADVVLPCCDYFNPGWEIELGTGEGALQHRRAFARKIDPVVNGICNMEKFEPIQTIKTDTPTVVMLSHVQYVKDIKNAIMATDLIVNKWGFKDYRLHIYGDMERAAGHSTECQELIASKGLGDACVLKGLGNASLVLQDAWIFLNSSISEGLPLAMGEAALTGVPVVCTDVGASFCVVTNRTTGEPFSEVVPPNDCESLARAQVNILALLGKWASYAEDAPGVLPPILSYPNPTTDEVRAISARMYEKKEHRRKLGMTGRENVLKNFNSERYLREHEQMLWIGKYRSPSYQDAVRKYNFNNTHGAFAQANSAYPSAGPSVDPSRNNSMTGLPMLGDREKKSFGLSMTSLPRVPSTPRLTPDRWSNAPSSRASSIWKFKPEQAPW
ncbi:glycosyltransferase family 4 protein [Dothidotthia symphoricarpi CBS 119687]|uniref:Glycosyltransferase family 4 protein n=1 Tax=Dothidotthia symphoricarpi CBS 119687 TaxID=1392245 RepID=A0A6A6A853_9PLEO|nr:glycosyltransferase family 4 protein [Dothidotthia symphoricarpi CBS 119687]KAF2126988.1 glycosyltransferase family 4 protein [Dothidotthia symphoricarpi CBS 119687]